MEHAKIHPKMLKALEKSLRDWTDLRDGLYSRHDQKPKCALCEQQEEFEQAKTKEVPAFDCAYACGYCPIRMVTGMPFCENSPWWKSKSGEGTEASEMVEFLKEVKAHVTVQENN